MTPVYAGLTPREAWGRHANDGMGCRDPRLDRSLRRVRCGRRGVVARAPGGDPGGLLGPNGAGKTSVIRALTTIVPVSGGTANINGHDFCEPAAVRSSIGVLPESNGYPGAQSERSYLRFYGELFGLPRSVATARAERRLG